MNQEIDSNVTIDSVQKKLITRSFSFEDEDDEANNNSPSSVPGKSVGEKTESDHTALTRAQKRNLRRKKMKEKLHNQAHVNQDDSSIEDASDEFFVSRLRKFKKKELDVNHHEYRELKRRNSDYFLDDYYL